MDRIDAILEDYERDLRKAAEGRCTKISRCAEFRDGIKRAYREIYAPALEALIEKLAARGHHAEISEGAPEDLHYGFVLSVIPRHLLSCPIDRFYPLQLRSSISFIANEHTLSIDVKRVINPSMEKTEGEPIEKIPREQFSTEVMIRKIGEFLETVFDETILLDFREV